MPRYKTRNQTALANRSEKTHQITSKRKLEHANEYCEEPTVPQTSVRNPKKKDIPSKDVNPQKKPTNLKCKRQRKSPSAETSCEDNKSQINSSTPKLMKSKKVFQQLQKQNEVELLSTKMKNRKFVNTLPNSNGCDLDSQVSKVQERKKNIPKMKNVSGKYKTGTKVGFPETCENEYELQSAPILSNSVVTESSIPCVKESDEVIPQIKHVARTNSQANGRPSKTYEKSKESSSTNSSPDIVEIIDIFNQVKQYCFKNKRVGSRKTKKPRIEPETTSPNSNPCVSESNIAVVQKPIEVTQQIKHVSQTCTRTKEILSTTCKENDNTCTNSSLNVTEIDDVTPQVKTKLCSTKRRKTKASSTSNTEDLESNVSNSEVTPQVKQVSQTYAGTKKIFSKTWKKNNSVNMCTNSSLNVTETDDDTPQVKTKLCSTKIRKAKDLLDLNIENLELNISNAEESTEVTPQIKHVARTYSRTKARLSKTCEKNDGFQSSSINLCLNIPESKEHVPQVKQCGVKKCNSRSLSSIKRPKESKNGLLNSISDDFESLIAGVEELNDEVSPQIKNAARKCKRRLAKIKPTNGSKKCLLNSTSDDCELLMEVSPQIKSAARKCKRQSLAKIKPTNGPKKGLLNSTSDDCELLMEVSPQIKPAVRKCKRQSLTNIKPTNGSKKGLLNSSAEDCELLIADVQELNDEVSSQIKPAARKCKKVCFATPCVDELLGNSSNSTIDISKSEMSFDFLPIITKSCENRLKNIVSTAVQIQRHSHRRTLTETDFIKALTFHNYFDDDITEHKIDSETFGDETSEFMSLTCQGKWLHK